MRERFAFVAFVAPSTIAGTATADTWVNGHFRSDGTYVQGHYRSDRNDYHNDNWSTEGNYNPYTGERGTKPR